MTIGQEFSEIAAKTDELRKEYAGISEKEEFMRGLMQMMFRASFDGDMTLPLDLRITLCMTILFDGDELLRLRDWIDRELS